MLQLEDKEEVLRKMLASVETLAGQRKELSGASEGLCKALSMLASCEENTALAR